MNKQEFVIKERENHNEKNMVILNTKRKKLKKWQNIEKIKLLGDITIDLYFIIKINFYFFIIKNHSTVRWIFFTTSNFIYVRYTFIYVRYTFIYVRYAFLWILYAFSWILYSFLWILYAFSWILYSFL